MNNNLTNIVKTLGMEYPEFNNLISLDVISVASVELPLLYQDVKYITDGEMKFKSSFGFKYMQVSNFKYIAIYDKSGMDTTLKLYINHKNVDDALTLFEAHLDDLL